MMTRLILNLLLLASFIAFIVAPISAAFLEEVVTETVDLAVVLAGGASSSSSSSVALPRRLLRLLLSSSSSSKTRQANSEFEYLKGPNDYRNDDDDNN